MVHADERSALDRASDCIGLSPLQVAPSAEATSVIKVAQHVIQVIIDIRADLSAALLRVEIGERITWVHRHELDPGVLQLLLHRAP